MDVYDYATVGIMMGIEIPRGTTIPLVPTKNLQNHRSLPRDYLVITIPICQRMSMFCCSLIGSKLQALFSLAHMQLPCVSKRHELLVVGLITPN